MRPVRTVNSVYVASLVAAIYERGLTVPFIKQTTGIQNLDVGAFLTLPWAVPSTSEQRRIAGELATRHAATSSLRSALTRQLDLLVEHRPSASHGGGDGWACGWWGGGVRADERVFEESVEGWLLAGAATSGVIRGASTPGLALTRRSCSGFGGDAGEIA